ncbi:MAG: hypothetical protein OXB88_05250 [Bacteriovoracales bacterium]|nr:hypothetical protein [Bacteriovoracales bacterium]
MGTTKKATFEDVWASLRELSQSTTKLKESTTKLKESTTELKEGTKGATEGIQELKESIKELRESQKETDRQLKETDNRFNSQWGKLIESLVEGDIVRHFSKRGLKVQGTSQRIKKFFEGQEHEFDILVHNGDELVVIEVKTTLKVEKVDHFIGKLKNFKKAFSEYADKKIYGAVAYIVADEESDKYSQRKGLFVIRATGNSSTIVNPKSFRPASF